MERTEILNSLKDIFKEALSETDEKLNGVTEATDLREDLGMDSIGMLCMAVMIEDKFSIQFGDVGLAALHTVSDVIDCIQKKA